MFVELLFLALGCGSVADGDYLGEPLFRLEGRVLEDEFDATDSDVSVALVWAQVPLREVQSQPVRVRTSFPARYTIDVYAPPEPEAVQPLSGASDVQAAVGEIVLFDDADGDGRWSGTETILGGAFDAVLMWIDPASLAAAEAALPFAVQAGYNLVGRQPWASCALPLVGQLGPALPPSTDLNVGYYWPILRSAECSGGGDFEDLLGRECAPDTWLRQECDLYADLLLDPTLAKFLSDAVGPDAFQLQCLERVCPDVVARLR